MINKTLSTLGIIGLMTAAPLAFAQKAGDTLYSLGMTYSLNLGTPVTSAKIESIAIPNATPGAPTIGTIYPNGLYQTGFATLKSNFIVPMIWIQRYLTENLSLLNYTTYPPRVTIKGAGTGEKYGPIIAFNQFTPTFSLNYTFGKPEDTFRPFIGPSITFVYPINIRIINKQWEKDQFNDPHYVKVRSPLTYTVGLFGGGNYWISDSLYLRGVVGYVPLKTTSQIIAKTRKLPKSDVLPPSAVPLPEGQEYELRTRSTLTSHTLMMSFGVGYRF